MLFTKKFIILVINLYVLLSLVQCDVLENERSSFFGFIHEMPISSSTLELVEHLQQAVQKQARGDRRVRRYFDDYNTPFIGVSRRKLEKTRSSS